MAEKEKDSKLTERQKQEAAVKAFLERTKDEPRVTIVDEDGAVHSVPMSLYRKDKSE